MLCHFISAVAFDLTRLITGNESKTIFFLVCPFSFAIFNPRPPYTSLNLYTFFMFTTFVVDFEIHQGWIYPLFGLLNRKLFCVTLTSHTKLIRSATVERRALASRVLSNLRHSNFSSIFNDEFHLPTNTIRNGAHFVFDWNNLVTNCDCTWDFFRYGICFAFFSFHECKSSVVVFDWAIPGFVCFAHLICNLMSDHRIIQIELHTHTHTHIPLSLDLTFFCRFSWQCPVLYCAGISSPTLVEFILDFFIILRLIAWSQSHFILSHLSNLSQYFFGLVPTCQAGAS